MTAFDGVCVNAFRAQDDGAESDMDLDLLAVAMQAELHAVSDGSDVVSAE